MYLSPHVEPVEHELNVGVSRDSKMTGQMAILTLEMDRRIVRMARQNVLGINRSFYSLLPSKWCREHGIEKGSAVRLFETEDGKLIIAALEEE